METEKQLDRIAAMKNAITLVCACLASLVAHAQDAGFTYTLPPAAWQNVNYSSGMYNLQLDKLRQGPGGTASLRPDTQDGAAKLAAAYPKHMQLQAETALRTLLEKYTEVERHFGMPHGELAGAMAMFIAASFEGYTGRTLEDAHYRALLKQMRSSLARQAEFASAAERDKRDAYEQMAILGMLMAATHDQLDQQPNTQTASGCGWPARDTSNRC